MIWRRRGGTGVRGFDLSLYLVTDPVLVGERGVVCVVEEALRGGVTLVQLRDKTASDDDFSRLGEALLRLLRPRGVGLIINDRVEIARFLRADGVHVGQSDLDPAAVRQRIGPDAILGLSAGTPAALARLPANGVDYIGIGPVAATGTKPDHDPPIGLTGLADMVARVHLPSVAIGGIGLSNAAAVMATGVGGIAVVSAICAAADPAQAAKDLLDSIERGRAVAQAGKPNR
jgi:thiamine-phosphate pyrophosphorylase